MAPAPGLTGRAGLKDLALRHPGRAAFLVAVVLYLPTLAFPFLDWDDFMYVMKNPRIHDSSLQGLFGLWDIGIPLSGKFVEYFPLRDSIWWLTWIIGSKTPAAFHAVNIVAHGLASSAVVLFAGRLRLDPRACLLAGVIFAVHPAHVESVAWVSALKDPLFTSFSLLSLCLLIDAAEARPGDRTGPRWALSVVALVAALLCKSLALAVPIIGLVFLISSRRSPWLIVPHVVVVALFLLVFLAVGEANDVIRAPRDGSRLTSLLTGAWCLPRYLQLALVPAGLAPYHAVTPYVAGLDDPRAVVGVAVVVVIVAVGVWALVRRHTLVAVSLALFVAPLLPVLHLVAIPIDLADRFLYLPICGVAVAVGVLARGRVELVFIACVPLGALTLLTESAWSDDVALWSVAVDGDGEPRAMPWMFLGSAHKARGDLDAAEAAYAQGLARQRSAAGWLIGSNHRRVAEVAFAKGELARAEHHARIAAVASDDAEPWGMLSYLARARGDTETAVLAGARARAAAPDDVRMVEAYGRALAAAGDVVAARRELEHAVSRDRKGCARLGALLKQVGSDVCAP